MYSMYFRYFWCIGNRYSVFYENYLISQFTVRKSFFAHFLLLLIKDESHSSASRQQKLASRRTEIWWEKSKLDALKSTIHTASPTLQQTQDTAFTTTKIHWYNFSETCLGRSKLISQTTAMYCFITALQEKKYPQPFPFFSVSWIIKMFNTIMYWT